MEESECCGASRWLNTTDICNDCKEHADFTDEEILINNNEKL
jgi:hypothetical protein